MASETSVSSSALQRQVLWTCKGISVHVDPINFTVFLAIDSLFISFVWLLIAFPSFVFGIPSNISVDDSLPDPLTGRSILYSPGVGGTVASGNWQEGQTCTCADGVDPSQAFNGTWHYGEANIVKGMQQSATLFFSGSAVYVMCIWVSVAPKGSLGNADMTFELNGTVVKRMAENVTTGEAGVYAYNTPVYVNEALPSGLHNMTIRNGLAGRESVMMLDRIIYTTEVEGSNQGDFGSGSSSVSPTSMSTSRSLIATNGAHQSIPATTTTTATSISFSDTGSSQPTLASHHTFVSSASAVSTNSADAQVSSSTSGHRSSTRPAIIAGISVGGTVASFVIGTFAFLSWRRRSLARRVTVEPFQTPVIEYVGPNSEEAVPPAYSGMVDVSVNSPTIGSVGFIEKERR
ncbi:hypothetical protein SCHPADRAFT_872204 [Schizopora paradoxa]|uniref:Uncharacterized protein n=1 Tax=Schizopora paradoxa TaxID=27342 RepID=A0A0H2RS18_9AGAM|nr:hypothetical protein SCHPADRAFT_872204 [Schizopora paradoxa]